MRSTASKPSAGPLAANQDAAANKADLRFAKRKQSKLPALISHPTFSQPLHCTVRDSSSTGALIELLPLKGPGAHVIDRFPKRFTLTIPIERVAFECDVAWQKHLTIGARYAAPARALAKAVRQKPKTEEPSGLMVSVLKKAGIKVS